MKWRLGQSAGSGRSPQTVAFVIELQSPLLPPRLVLIVRCCSHIGHWCPCAQHSNRIKHSHWPWNNLTRVHVQSPISVAFLPISPTSIVFLCTCITCTIHTSAIKVVMFWFLLSILKLLCFCLFVCLFLNLIIQQKIYIKKTYFNNILHMESCKMHKNKSTVQTDLYTCAT